MSAPEPDILRRGQEIFERLRGGTPETQTEGTPEPPEDVPEQTTEETPATVDTVPDEGVPAASDTAEPAQQPDVPAAVATPGSETESPTVVGVLAEPTQPPVPDESPAQTPTSALTQPATPEPAAVAVETAATPARAVHPASLRPLPRVVAIANQKGGVGKTTTTVNSGAGLAELGFRVLVIDLDPQGNATTGLGINSRNLEISIYDVLLHDVALDDCIEPTAVRNLFVAPATIDLAGADIELVPAFSRELRLRRAIEGLDDSFDFTIIDCPPSLGLITVNGLAAANEVIVPIQCEYYALEGLGQLLKNVNLVTGNLNPTLEISAIVLTMYDSRTKLAEQVAEEVREHFGEKVCRMVIPRTVRLSEAPSFGQPILTFDPTSRGAVAYRELAKEVSGGTP